MKLSSLIFTLIVIFLVGCSSTTRIDHILKKMAGERQLVVFFDGTANDESSHTNVAKLHNLVTLQDRQDISTTYIKGIGTGAKVIGMAMGWGIGNDAREAYLYLLENYDPEYDHVSIFGFSRGAYTSRILAALLYVAGLPDVQHLTKNERKSLVDDIYAEYKNKQKIKTRRDNIAKMIRHKWGEKLQYDPKPVNVRFLGLWETVEALGWPDLKENINEPNEYYADQLCNIEAASHALALDDNRARIFTPLLLSRKHLREEECDEGQVDNNGKINEVWFSGAHSDVGGGYKDTDINGISLNWMLDEIEGKGLNLVPKNTKVYSDYLGSTHDPEAGLFGLIYRARNRNISCYTEHENSVSGLCVMDSDSVDYKNSSTSLSSPLKVHQSVLDRLCLKPPENHESFWFREDKYKNCLTCNENNRGQLSDNKRCQKNIKVIETDRYQYQEVTLEDNYCDYSSCWGAKETAYKGTKSCNYFQHDISERAKQRLTKKHLNKAGEHQSIVVYADVKNDRTGIYLSKDASYRFEIQKEENWVDCTITDSNPYSGRATWDSNNDFSGNILSAIAKPFTYAPSSGYMELLGEVANQQFKLGRLAKSGEVFTPSEDGELILRVNEPKLLKTVYDNNFGVLKLVIKVN